MRVLFLTDSYYPSRSACANRAVVLVDAMVNAGMEVEVLASSDSLDSTEVRKREVNVTYFKTFPLSNKTAFNRFRNNISACISSIKAARGMGSFDVVIYTSPPLLLALAAMYVAKRKKAKLVLDVRDIWPDVAYEIGTFDFNSLYGRLFERIAERAYSEAALVTTVSPGKLKKLCGRIPEYKVELVPNGIDESFLDNEEDALLVSRFRLFEGPICSYVGNIGLAQGLDALLDIASKRPNVRFLIFGKGAEKARLEARVENERLFNVEFCGCVNAAGVFTVLRHSAISYVPLVNSSLKDSIPTKLYECLGSGCPVLLVADGDSVSLLEESGLGRHVTPENAEGILKAFDEMISKNYSLAQRNAARDYVIDKHSRQKHAKKFAQLIALLFGETR